jgi:hypothetical protein
MSLTEAKKQEQKRGLFPKPSPKDGSDVKRILPRHRRIIEMALDGMDYKGIAEGCGMSPRSVSLILKSPLVACELSRRRADIERKRDEGRVREVDQARELLERKSLEAAERTVSLLESGDDSVALRAADRILDRVLGDGKDGGGNVVLIDASESNNLKVALMESRQIQGSRASEKDEV